MYLRWRGCKLAVPVVMLSALLVLALTGVAAAADPVNGITIPAEGAKVSGIVNVSGYANDSSFARWQLDLLPGGDATKAVPLRTSATPGEVAYSLDTTVHPAGAHVLRLRVVRPDGNYKEYLTNFTITAPTVLQAPVIRDPGSAQTVTTDATSTSIIPNGITAPAEGAKVSGVVKVSGYANDPNFARWQLDLLSGSDATKAAPLAASPTSGAVAYSLDTSVYPLGAQVLRLRVIRPDGNYNEYRTNFSTVAPTTQQTPVIRDPGSAQTVTGTSDATATIANGITAPTEGSTVSGVVKVSGYANDPNFGRWQLDLLPGGDAAKAMPLTTSLVPGEVAYSLDSSVYPTGAHVLRLRVVRPDGNYVEYPVNLTISR